jgi:hypothetical protein
MFLGALVSTGSIVPSVGAASRLVEAMPFFLGALYYVFMPFFIKQTQQRLVDYLEKVDTEWQGSREPPPHLAPRAVAITVEWTTDATQVVPTLLLPVAGAVFALRSNSLSAAVLAFSALIISVICLWIYSQSPVEYRARRYIFHRYTIISIFGIILNIAVAIVLLTL